MHAILQRALNSDVYLVKHLVRQREGHAGQPADLLALGVGGTYNVHVLVYIVSSSMRNCGSYFW